MLTHTPCFAATCEGATIMLALWAASNVQNVFLLKQGLFKTHIVIVVLLVGVSDIFVNSLGIIGVGSLIAKNPLFLSISRWGGVAFLIAYGAMSLRSAAFPHVLEVGNNGIKAPSLKKTLAAFFAITFLNPYNYMDSIIFLGTLTARLTTEEKLFFLAGGTTISFLWPLTVCYGASLLRPFFAKPIAWRILDFIIGCLLLAMGVIFIFVNPF